MEPEDVPEKNEDIHTSRNPSILGSMLFFLGEKDS